MRLNIDSFPKLGSTYLATANISVKLGTNISDVAIPKMTVATTVSHSLLHGIHE